jgi:hypothetical protein
LNAQVKGLKQVVLYAPDQMKRLYTYFESKAHPGNFSQVDVEAPDPQRFPLFEEAEGYGSELQAGEMLFIPSYWYHSFKHLGDFNVNVNFWWLPERIRLSPPAIRDALARAAYHTVAQSKLAPLAAVKLFGQLEHTVVQSDLPS